MVFAYIDLASSGMIAAVAAGGIAGVRAMARSAWDRRGHNPSDHEDEALDSAPEPRSS